MPDLARQGPFSYDSLSRTGNGEYTLDKSDFNADNGEILEVIVNGVKIEGDGTADSASTATNKNHGFYVDSLTNPTKITLVSNPSSGGAGTVKIYRLSNRSSASVDFAPGSVIREQDLDNSTSQTLHVAQEAIDIALNGITLAINDEWDANSKVIKSVADGSNANDAVNKGQLTTHDTTITGYRDTTLGYKEDTEDYKLEATDWAQKINGGVKVYTDNQVTGNALGFSAKAHAIGGTDVTGESGQGAAKDWAIGAGGTMASKPDGSEFSAKEYAQGVTATGGTAKGWASTAYGNQVPGAGSDDRSALHYSTDASNSATAAKNSAAAVAQVYDNFSDVYLGSMRTDKTSADAATITGASWAKDSSEIAFTGVSSGTVTIGQELTSTSGNPNIYPVGANIIGTQTTSPIVISNPFTAAGTGATLVFVGSGVYGAFGDSVGGPTLNNDGDALVDGNLYFNSQENEMRIWQGAEWIAATAVGQSSLLEYKFVTTSGQVSSKTYSGTADVGGTLSYTQNNIIVFMNGVQLKDTTDYTATNNASVVLVNAPALNDEINIIAFKSFTTADMVSASNGGTFSSSVTFGAGLVANTADINAGTFDGVVGGTTPAAGSFTTLVGTSLNVSEGNITNVGDIALDTISADGSSITFNDVIKGTANNTDITGTIDPAANTTTVTGVNTAFLTEATVGDQLVLHQGTANEETRTITAIASDTSLTVNTTFTDNGNDTTPEIHPASFVVTDDSNGIDFLIDTDGNIETSTTGKIKQKGSFMQSSTHQALTLGY